MADLSDVSAALVTLAAQVLYPNGTAQPSAAGIPCKIYPGWPLPAQLDTDLAASIAHVSVFPRQEEKNTTRYPKEWQTLSINTPTLTISSDGQSITIGGTVTAPQNVVAFVNRKPYVYAVQVADTLDGIATALAALIAVDVAGTVSTGPVITLPPTARIGPLRIGTIGTSIMEIRRQERVFQMTVWANSDAHRTAIAKLIDLAVADTEFMTLSDGTAARVIYKGSPITDMNEKATIYRRDILATVEYATTKTMDSATITQQQFNISAQIDGATDVSAVTTIFE